MTLLLIAIVDAILAYISFQRKEKLFLWIGWFCAVFSVLNLFMFVKNFVV